MKNTNSSIILATGGTGGHVLPAYSLAKYLIKNGYDITITSDTRGLQFLDNYSKIKVKKIETTPLKKNIIFSII